MIIANWKTNGSKQLVEEWINFVSQKIEINQKKECIFCPPTCYLDFAASLLKYKCKELKLGSQLLDPNTPGPLTGGTNSEMLVDLGCRFVIIGHSEQRIHFKEDNRILSDKLKVALDSNLRPIFCIGESLKQKNNNDTQNVLLKQLDALPSDFTDDFIIAYEPIWAIGTGENAEIDYIQEIHSFIKEEVKTKINSNNYISVVYGGSVNLKNYKDIYSSDHVDGLLIGGASLDPNTFSTIYNNS